jgi:hypothetical protein
MALPGALSIGELNIRGSGGVPPRFPGRSCATHRWRRRRPPAFRRYEQAVRQARHCDYPVGAWFPPDPGRNDTRKSTPRSPESRQQPRPRSTLISCALASPLSRRSISRSSDSGSPPSASACSPDVSSSMTSFPVARANPTRAESIACCGYSPSSRADNSPNEITFDPNVASAKPASSRQARRNCTLTRSARSSRFAGASRARSFPPDRVPVH